MQHRISNQTTAADDSTGASAARAGTGERGGAAPPPANPKAGAPIDLTGYWVSIVDEDWRFRMVVPPPGDYEGVPMTPAAVKFADAWDPAKDEASGDLCRAFGAPAILRQPEHLHITWPDDHTLRMDTNTGTQTASVSFRRLESSRRSAHIAGGFDGRVGHGASGARFSAAWIAEGHHVSFEGRLPAQERRAL